MVAYLLKPEKSEDFHQIVDFLNTSHIKYALTKNPTIHVSLIQQFWQTASASTNENGEMEITATIDGRVKTVTEASIRRHLKLEDSDGISTLPNTEIFEQLALMGHGENLDSPNLQGQGSTVQSDSHYTTTSSPSTSQPKTSPPSMQITHVAEEAATLPHDSPFLMVYSLGSDEGSMTLHELMVLCTTLSKKVESLESDLKQTKLTYGVAFIKLIMKGRSMIEDIDQDAGVSLVQIDAEDQGRFEDETDTQVSAHGEAHSQGSQPEDQLGVFSAAKILADVARVHTYSRRRRTVSTGSGGISTAKESVSTVGASMPVSTAGMDQGSIPSPSASKDKGKAIMTESEPEQATTKLKQRQEIAGYEAAIRLQEQLDEEESQRIARDAEVAQRLQEEIDASERQRMAQLQAGEKYSKEDLPMKLVELVIQRKKFFAQQRDVAKRNKPMTPAQQKAYMSTYIKNKEGGYSIKQLKSLSFEQRLKRAGQEVFEETVKRQKIEEASGSGEEQSAEKEKELSEEDLQKLMMIVPMEEVYVEALQVKYPIIDWDVYIEESRKYWKIIKVERFSSTDPTDDKERILWVKLKRLFEPDIDDILWKLQRYMHDPFTWRLYDTCGVHHVSRNRGHDIFMLVEKDYPLTRGLMTVMLANKLPSDQIFLYGK
ncbi:hypothetical protein Tco_1194203 [Tanacetum coccineum]